MNKEKRHAFVKMISRADALTAKEAMEKNRTPDSQLRVSLPLPYFVLMHHANGIANRPDGVLGLGHVIAVTIPQVSASFLSASSLMQTESGC